MDKRQSVDVSSIIYPMFDGRHGEFFLNLELPILSDYKISEPDAKQCGRHVANYLANNPDEAYLFLNGVRRWFTITGKDFSDCNPASVAELERDFNEKAEVHLTSYRAMEALMTNNHDLKCFTAVDYGKLVQDRMLLEIRADKFDEVTRMRHS